MNDIKVTAQPAAPEPSELQKRLDATNAMRERAESAEAQLAAASERIRKALVYLTDKDDVESTPSHAIGHAVYELTHTPSPGAGEKP